MSLDSHHALVLSGGGARGAFQAGALRALCEICREQNKMNLFKILTGVSAGAINATYLASKADRLDTATKELCKIWQNIRAEDVFRTDYLSITKSALRLMRGLSLGGLNENFRPLGVSLLNTNPLRQFLSQHIHFANIRTHIRTRDIHALALTATDYGTSMSVSFVEGGDFTPSWKRTTRLSQKEKIAVEHVMASSAIPIFFPPVAVQSRHYGDGCVRNMAPLSPSIHLGARRLVVIGVRKWKQQELSPKNAHPPTLGRVTSVLLNAIFLDAVETDLERLRIINRTLDLLPEDQKKASPLHHIDSLYIHPSSDLADIAQAHSRELPRALIYLLDSLGSVQESSEVLSYLLFEPGYCSSLVDLGYQDTMNRKHEIESFLDQGIES